jgi:hypothetical protein
MDFIIDGRAANKAHKQAKAAVKRLPPTPSEWEERYQEVQAAHKAANGPCTCDPNAPESRALRDTAALVNRVYREFTDRNKAVYDYELRHCTRAWLAKQAWRKRRL